MAQTATERTDTRWVINSQTLISSEEVTRNASPSPSEGETSQSRTNERTLHLWISGVWGGGWGGEVQGQAHLVKKEKKGTEYRKEGRRHCLTLFFTF